MRILRGGVIYDTANADLIHTRRCSNREELNDLRFSEAARNYEIPFAGGSFSVGPWAAWGAFGLTKRLKK